MTDIQTWLDQGKALAGQATEGPWEAYEDSDYQPAGCPPIIEHLVYAGAVETPIIDWGNGSTKADAEFIADARTRLPQALNALQAVLDLHQPRTIYEPAGDWDGEGKYEPYCVHGDDADHPDHKMIDGWWQCTTSPETVCNEATEGDPWPWPCPTVRAIQDAIGEDA